LGQEKRAMKNVYLRNMLISVAVHVACVYVLIAFSLYSCHSRRLPKDLTFFVDFQPGPPPPPEPVAVPKPIPEPPKMKSPKPKTTPTEKVKKTKIKISTNIIRRVAAPGAKRPVKQLSAAQIRRMLGNAMASVAPPAGVPGSGEATPYGWYLAQVRAVMYDAWAQPSALAGKRGLVTSVLIRVRQDGRIVQKKMVDTSGNGRMDTSVMAAVESVKNLPELPFGFGGAYKDITIDFELEDTEP